MNLDGRALADALADQVTASAEERLAWANRCVEAIAQGCPELTLDPARFAEHVGARAGQRPLAKLRGFDLAIAFGCACGAPGAIGYLDRELLPKVRPAVLRALGGRSSWEDASQRLRERLLVAGDGPARIASYGGEAPLEAWLRATAVRVALNEARGAQPELAEERRLAELPEALDPEADALRRLDQARFAEAFTRALATLEPRERTMLKLYLLDGVSLSSIGAMYGVDKSSASRWLAAARGRLLEATRATLAEELGLDPKQALSLIRAVRSQLQLSLSRLFAE